ncbi:Fic family protein [Candidatus Babeliales bacterium]|nr:Fic family protein [Candidatus Babeliales bacterium]
MYKEKLIKIDELQKEINNYRPLNSRTKKELKEYYRIGLTYTSNAIEGNSLTETETKIVLEEGITIGGKLLKDHFEAVGASERYDLLYKLVKVKKITEKDILKIHKLFYFRLDPKRAGKYRKEQVFITGTDFIPPKSDKIPELMAKFIQELNTLKKRLHTVELAAIAHKDLVSIHPFIDGNGRTARLLMNLILLQNDYAITIIPPIMRNEYISALKKAQTNNHEPKTDKYFINFICDMVYESQKEYLRLLKTLK